MGEPHITFGLKAKAIELEALIRNHEAALAKARHDLSVITSALLIFKREGGLPMSYTPGASVRHLFGRDEAWTICKTALEAEPDGLSTRELANACTGAKGFDTEDAVLRKAMQATLTGILGKRERKRQVARIGKRHGCTAWRLVTA